MPRKPREAPESDLKLESVGSIKTIRARAFHDIEADRLKHEFQSGDLTALFCCLDLWQREGLPMTTLPPWVIDEWCTKGASFYREQIDWIEYEALREAINQLRDLQTTAVRNKDDRRAEELKAEIERQEEKAKAHRSRYSGKHEARNMEVIVGWRTGKQKRGTALQESNIQVRNRWFLTEYRRLVKLATESKQVNNPPAIYEGPIGYPVEILDPRTGKPSKGFTVALARACGFKGKNDPAIYRQVCDIKINGLSSEI